jgi:hypothetical protein
MAVSRSRDEDQQPSDVSRSCNSATVSHRAGRPLPAVNARSMHSMTGR